MIISGTEKLYKDYAKKRYFFSDGILYRMCQENPDHKKQDVIIGKILLIGRTYAAAIERRKDTGNYKGDDFYNDGPVEDYLLEEVKKYQEPDFDQIIINNPIWPVYYHLSYLRHNIINSSPPQRPKDKRLSFLKLRRTFAKP